MDITLDVEGLEDIDRTFAGVQQRASDPRPILQAIARDVELVFGQAFGGDPSFIRTGALEASLTQAGDDNAVMMIDIEEMFRGTDVWYGIFHKEELFAGFDTGVESEWGEKIRSFILRGSTQFIGIEGL